VHVELLLRRAAVLAVRDGLFERAKATADPRDAAGALRDSETGPRHAPTVARTGPDYIGLMSATAACIPSLLEVCSFHFEKNEIIDGWATPRDVPFPSIEIAQEAFDRLCVEATRLLGASRDFPLAGDGAKATECPGTLRIGVSGRLVRVMVARPRFGELLYGEPDWESLEEHQGRLEALWKPLS
jgi:hypothetical protein